MNNSRHDIEKNKYFNRNRRYDIKGKGKLDNRGFSLLELLVSIIILILIMVPLMNNFVRSVKLNDDAENMQGYSYIASDLVEDIKAGRLADIKTYTNYKDLKVNADNITFSEFTPTGLEDTSYFSIEKSAEDKKYDVLVKISTEDYIYNGTAHSGTLMNDYDMPEISTVDEDINGMLYSHMFQEGSSNILKTEGDPDKDLDQIALKYFTDAAKAYADEQFKHSTTYTAYLSAMENWQTNYQNWKTKYQEAILKKEAPPTAPTQPVEPSRTDNPDYCDADNISDWMTKTAEITVDKVSGQSKSVIDYKINYSCDWTKSTTTGLTIDNSESYPIQNRTYGTQINNLYYYYSYSIFQQYNVSGKDVINITNNSEKQINFYLVKQKDVIATNPSVKIGKYGLYGINIYTNLPDGKVDVQAADDAAKIYNKKIVKSSKQDRIYSITVSIYDYVNGATELKYQGIPLYVLNSNKDQ